MPNTDTLHALIREYRDARKIPLNVEHRLMLGMAPDYENLTVIQKVEVFEHALESTSGMNPSPCMAPFQCIRKSLAAKPLVPPGCEQSHRTITLPWYARMALPCLPYPACETLPDEGQPKAMVQDRRRLSDCTSATGEDLHRVLWLKSRSSEVWLERRTHYTRSCAVMSMVCSRLFTTSHWTVLWCDVPVVI